MIILRESKLVFVKTRKTGGTSIEIALGQSLQKGDFASPLTPDEEAQRPGKRSIVRQSVKLLRERSKGAVHARYPHQSMRTVDDYLSDIAEGCTSFCVERNPWDKAVSAFYFWMHRRGKKINEPEQMFAHFCSTRLQYFSDFHLYTKNGDLRVDRVLRFENLRHEFEHFLAERGVKGISLEHVKAKSGIRKSDRFELFYGAAWDNRNVEIVADIFAAEIEMFGYQVPKSIEQPSAEPTN